MKSQIKSGLVVFITASFFVSAFATAGRGKDIINAVDHQDDGFSSSIWRQELILTNALGKENRRVMSTTNLEGDDVHGDKTLIVFSEPKDSKGISLLTHGIKNDDDMQWMYLPNLKRVRRIAPGAKVSAFVGSEFTFEDLAVRELEDYSYKFIKETELESVPAYEIEVIPLDPKSGYSRQVAWVDEKKHIYLRVDFYDKKGKLEKSVFFEDYQLYLKRFWRPHTTRMVNHQTNKKSRFVVSGNYEFNQNFTEKDFSKNRLKRNR